MFEVKDTPAILRIPAVSGNNCPKSDSKRAPAVLLRARADFGWMMWWLAAVSIDWAVLFWGPHTRDPIISGAYTPDSWKLSHEAPQPCKTGSRKRAASLRSKLHIPLAPCTVRFTPSSYDEPAGAGWLKEASGGYRRFRPCLHHGIVRNALKVHAGTAPYQR